MDDADYDVAVLGSGPGGYVAAIRAGQLGMKAVVVERDALGGVCLNWGCIPSKALLRNAEVLNLVQNAGAYGINVERVRPDFGKAIDRSRGVVDRLTRGIAMLLRKNKVEHVQGTGVLEGPNDVAIDETGDRLSAENVIIATGARQLHIPALPIDRETVISSREAIVLREVPRRVVIVGGGATGCEFAYVWRSYGAEVTIVELMPRIVPNEDADISAELERAFRRQGIQILTGAQVRGIGVDSDAVKVSVSINEENSIIDCDKVLVAVGVQGNVDGIGLESAGVQTERGFIPVNESMQSNVPSIYAIGDVTGKLLLAHVASAQGVTAVEHIAGLDPPALDYGQMPRAIYCRPQVASFGLTEEQARAVRLLRQDREVPSVSERKGAGSQRVRGNGEAGGGSGNRRAARWAHDRRGGDRDAGRAWYGQAAGGHDRRAGLAGASASNHFGDH